MFSNATIYRLTSRQPLESQTLSEALAGAPFLSCTPTQQRSVGWVPPRGEAHGALVESVAGQLIMRLVIETKSVPADVVKREVDERVEQIKQETGRERLGKKEKAEIKEDVLHGLLPHAFPKRSSHLVWVDVAAGMLVIEAGSSGASDAVVSELIAAVDGLAIRPLQTATSPAAAMSHWLTAQEAPAHFSIDRECELKATDESKSVVRYGNHTLEIDEVVQHIQSGKQPTRLAMTWNDGISLVLTDVLTLKKIKMLDVVLEDRSGEPGFDTDVAIATGELRLLIPDLILALGGEAPKRV